jgi:MFS family permease
MIFVDITVTAVAGPAIGSSLALDERGVAWIATSYLITLAAGMAIGVADLDRTRLGLCMAWMGAHALTRSPIVHFDAVASVRAAHARAEIEQMARDAGLHGCAVGRAWPQRWRLWWQRVPETRRSSATT